MVDFYTSVNDSVYEVVVEHFKETCDLGHKPLFIALQGSQNYGLEYENSDVDTKAVILPTFSDFALCQKPVSTTHIRENKEHIDLKDLRPMFGNFWKQNVNFLEVLFSKYQAWNYRYEEFFFWFRDNAERIAHYNNYAAVSCMYGMGLEKWAAIEHAYPAQKEVVEKYGYSGKQLHHLMRMVNFMEAFLHDVPYKECLTTFDIYSKETMLDAKRQLIPYELGMNEGRKCVEWLHDKREEYMDTTPLKIDNEIKEEASAVVVEILKKSFLEEMSE